MRLYISLDNTIARQIGSYKKNKEQIRFIRTSSDQKLVSQHVILHNGKKMQNVYVSFFNAKSPIEVVN